MSTKGASGSHGETREGPDSYLEPGDATSVSPDVTETVLKTTSDRLKPPLLSGDVGYNLPAKDTWMIPVGWTVAIGTGIRVQLPPGTFGLILPRSRANIERLSVRTSVIDQGYRGELLVVVCNERQSSYTVKHGESLAQLVVLPALVPIVEVVEELDESERGVQGFGSTGA